MKAALHNLGPPSPKGALYVEAVAREDYEQDIIDEDLTDNRVFRHRAELYRRGLREGFVGWAAAWMARQPPGRGCPCLRWSTWVAENPGTWPHAVAACAPRAGPTPSLPGPWRPARRKRCPAAAWCPALRVQPAPRGAHPRRRVPADGRYRTPQAQQHRLADCRWVPDTFAFGWARTEVHPDLLELLADPQWQPYVVFPGEFVAPERVVTEVAAVGGASAGKRPLFILLLDATWPEARKMFRKSPYLDRFPVLSLQPEQISRYQLRRSRRTTILHRRSGRPVPDPPASRRPQVLNLPGRVHPPPPAGQAPAAARLAGRSAPAACASFGAHRPRLSPCLRCFCRASRCRNCRAPPQGQGSPVAFRHNHAPPRACAPVLCGADCFNFDSWLRLPSKRQTPISSRYFK